jgi:hypothetical protein
MKWLTDDEFFGTEVGTGVNSVVLTVLVSRGDRIKPTFGHRTFGRDRHSRTRNWFGVFPLA